MSLKLRHVLVMFLSLSVLIFSASCGDLGDIVEDCTIAACTNQGDTCDETTKKCVCDQAKCAEQDNSGCNPDSQKCETFCTSDEQCTDATRSKCVGEEGKKFCISPTDQCSSNTDCTNEATPVCDTTKTPKVCVGAAAGSCQSDDDCLNASDDFSKLICNNGTCVECLSNDDCPDSQCDTTTNTCSAAQSCTDTATCNASDPKSYCDSSCQIAPAVCSAASERLNSSRESWNGTGGVIYNVTTRRVTADECWSHANGNNDKQPCTDNSDCDSGAKCFTLGADKYCGKADSDGMVEVTFKYFNSGAEIDTGFTSIKVAGTSTEHPTTEASLEGGSGKDGTVTFGVCSKSQLNLEFTIKDKSGNYSNGACAVE